MVHLDDDLKIGWLCADTIPSQNCDFIAIRNREFLLGTSHRDHPANRCFVFLVLKKIGNQIEITSEFFFIVTIKRSN